METKNFCPECGHKLDGSGKFCPNCGFNLSTEETYTDNTAVVSQAVAPTNQNAMRITQQQNTSAATDPENEFFTKKQKDEIEKLRKQVKGLYIASLIFLVVFIVLLLCDGDWLWEVFKWIIFYPASLTGVIVPFVAAVNLNSKRKKVEKMSLMEYRAEIAKRERNEELAISFAKGFAQGYIREKFRKY